MGLLLLVGLPLALAVVFVWRSDTLTGVVGVILGVFCAAWLLRVIEVIDSQQMWSASLMPRTWYYVLVAGCGIVAVTSAWHVVAGLANSVSLRRRARVFVPGAMERPNGAATRVCPRCGGTIPAQAVACKYCGQDVPQ